MLIDLKNTPIIDMTDDEKIDFVAAHILRNYKPAFWGGNKRIGMYVILTFLEVNGIRLDCTNEEIVEVGLSLADGSMGYEALLGWVIAIKVFCKFSKK